MKPTLLLAVFMLGAAAAHAQSVQDDVATLEKKRAAEVARATDSVNRNYLREYEKLLQRANLVGDAQGANLVRTMIRRLNPEPEPSPSPDKKPGADPSVVLTSNHWMDEKVAADGRRHFFNIQFLPGGEMTGKKIRGPGTWKIVNNELVIEFTSFPNAPERFFLPPQLERWRGAERDGSAHYLSVEKSGDEAPAPAGSPAGTPATKPAGVPDYFGKPG